MVKNYSEKKNLLFLSSKYIFNSTSHRNQIIKWAECWGYDSFCFGKWMSWVSESQKVSKPLRAIKFISFNALFFCCCCCCSFLCFQFFCLVWFLSFFLGPHLKHIEVPRLGVQLELQLLVQIWAVSVTYPAAHGNAGPLSKSKDRTCPLMDTSRIRFCWATMGTPSALF